MCSRWLRNDAIAFAVVFVLVWQLLSAVAARADDTDQSKASASLALAKAKREREATKAAPVSAIDIDRETYAKAAKVAKETGKPLVLWVGMKCEDHPGLCKALGNAVHCVLSERDKDPTPRIVINGNDGIDYYVLPEKIAAETAMKIWLKWSSPASAIQGARAKVIEELSYRPAPASATPVSRG